MIRQVTLRGFKRFGETTFDLPGHVVIAGPNNTGKTTLLQAIAAASLAFNAWMRNNDFQRHNGYYTKVPITRQVFSAVPLRAFDLLWTNRKYDAKLEITIRHDAWKLTMEFHPQSTEQIYVRPSRDIEPNLLSIGGVTLSGVYVPPMSGLSTDEPVLQKPKIEQLLGQSKPGDVLRNLLVVAQQDEKAWNELKSSIQRLFGYELLPPNATGPDILAEYQAGPGAPKLDIASAGSGFQQVLMLLTFLNTRAGSVLLLDEPDAHLHLILQDGIYGELRTVAQRQKSQLIVATHSEVIINSVEPRELCVLMNEPRMLSNDAEKSNLIQSLGALTNTDIMLAIEAPGVLYTEGHTDLAILKEWARVLKHPTADLLAKDVFWKAAIVENRAGANGVSARTHYEALAMVRENLPGLVIVDGDARPEIKESAIQGKGLQRVRWRRYEIESYLFHPAALARYVGQQVGGAAATEHVKAMHEYLNQNLPPKVVQEPLGEHDYLNTVKARTKLIPPILAAAGLHDIPYTRFHEIAAQMEPDEIHPEVREKLDAIQKAFGQ